jgi:hypothetical protein
VPDTFEIPPGDIEFIRVGYETRLNLGEREIMIESPFLVRTIDGQFSLDPRRPGGLGPLTGLFPMRLVRGYEQDGTLHLKFEGGSEVEVPPHEQFEAWQVTGPRRGDLVVCLGGGELAIWDGDSS